MGGRRQPEYLPQSNSEEGRSQVQASQREGLLQITQVQTDVRGSRTLSGAFCVREKGEWEGRRATTPKPNPEGRKVKSPGTGARARSLQEGGLLEMGLG